jgi:hypothetical protein
MSTAQPPGGLERAYLPLFVTFRLVLGVAHWIVLVPGTVTVSGQLSSTPVGSDTVQPSCQPAAGRRGRVPSIGALGGPGLAAICA